MQVLTALSSKLGAWLPLRRGAGGTAAVAPRPPHAPDPTPKGAEATTKAETGAEARGGVQEPPRLEVYTTGYSIDDVQGVDAPAHATLLYLLEKGVEVARLHVLDDVCVDDWLGTKCPGGLPVMPVLFEPATGTWVGGLAEIWEFVEQRLPTSRDMGRPATELSGGEVVLGDMTTGEQLPDDCLLGSLRRMLESADVAEAAAATEKLKATLKALEDWLAEHEMAFIGGDEPNATDCYVVAELAHVFLGGNLKRPGTLGQYPRLERYLAEWKARGSWRDSRFDERQVVQFWSYRATMNEPKRG